MQSRQISFHYVCPHPQGRNVSIKRSLIFINNSRFIEHAILYINCRTKIRQSHFSRDFGSEQHEFEPRSLSCIFEFQQSRSLGIRRKRKVSRVDDFDQDMARSGKLLLLLGLWGLAAAQIDPNVCPHKQQGATYKAWSATATWPNGVRFFLITPGMFLC